ncbi:MAG: RraA family protein, partial [Bryobacteraceae bacterium]
MKHPILIVTITAAAVGVGLAGFLGAESSGSIVDNFKLVEVASVADAMEQLDAQPASMSHDMRPLFPVKFAGPAVTVLLKKEENKDGSGALQGMLDAIDEAPAGSVYVIVLEHGVDIAGIGGLMATAMRVRGLAGAVVDASVRDTPQIRKIQFPVFSRGVSPATAVNHFRLAGVNVPLDCAGVRVNPGDIVAADEDGVVVVPKAHAADVLKKAQQLDDTEHRMLPF